MVRFFIGIFIVVCTVLYCFYAKTDRFDRLELRQPQHEAHGARVVAAAATGMDGAGRGEVLARRSAGSGYDNVNVNVNGQYYR